VDNIQRKFSHNDSRAVSQTFSMNKYMVRTKDDDDDDYNNLLNKLSSYLQISWF